MGVVCGEMEMGVLVGVYGCGGVLGMLICNR